MGVSVASVQYGAGRHSAYLDPEMRRVANKLNFIGAPIFLWAIPLVKVSIGFFLIRIRPTLHYTRIIQVVMVLFMSYTFASFIAVMIQCKNMAAFWDERVQTTCWPQSTLLGMGYAGSSRSSLCKPLILSTRPAALHTDIISNFWLKLSTPLPIYFLRLYRFLCYGPSRLKLVPKPCSVAYLGLVYCKY